MPSILEELYAGNILPDEMIVPRNPKYRPLCQQISTAMENWRKKLGEKEFGELEALLDLHAEASAMHNEAAFTHGFKLGAAILAEVLAGKEELVRSI
ncbi:MAG: hypothetical protein E7L01_07035 [Paenibacillus macerans]|uniref:DUF6809 family protein n=1 Tax=Paenibacillus TaxID=44249 RepID=UPI000EDE5293|nr:DUF6809 family protein [Paenibacillus macerans]MBS5913449.1 hypothetical protein [Paenibacillus macerans]MDU7473097.1 hypothetical protein [Paenibacillus macerans]MEC0330829.1 hypothetical protein [Paenibacillus macerans]GBK65169.1 hypothetical protein PbDSM24746_51730 [Paenibacillus macerans]GBK71452.1 hypothetical protein PbJCM17693_51600 [Paenibacillus macerans]